jgi:hypothetical protein
VKGLSVKTEQAGENTYRTIQVHTCIELNGQLFWVEDIRPIVKHLPDGETGENYREAEMVMIKAPQGRNHLVTYIRVNGLVETRNLRVLHPRRDAWKIERLREVKDDVGFSRHRMFDKSDEAGFSAEKFRLASQTWDGWFK